MPCSCQGLIFHNLNKNRPFFSSFSFPVPFPFAFALLLLLGSPPLLKCASGGRGIVGCFIIGIRRVLDP